MKRKATIITILTVLFAICLTMGCEKTKSYTITFKNHDGTILQSDLIEEGTMPAYTKESPQRYQLQNIRILSAAGVPRYPL